MRSELLRVQQEEMQRLHREFEVQLAAVKLQLQRTNEMHSKDVSYQLSFKIFVFQKLFSHQQMDPQVGIYCLFTTTLNE